MGENTKVNVPLTPTTEEFFNSIFVKADHNQDGYISETELNLILQETDDIHSDIAREMIGVSDKNNDGKLSHNEFILMVTNPNYSQFFGDYVRKYVQFIVPRNNRLVTDQQDGQYEEEYKLWPPKLAMLTISLVEVICFLTDEFLQKDSTYIASGPVAQALIYDPQKKTEIWRFLTYMFVHVGHLHLVVNLVVQIMLGIPLELVHGWRVILVYIAGVVAGSLGTSVGDPYVKLAGASGGVYSLLTAQIAAIIMNWNEMSFPLVQLIIFCVITISDVGYSIHNRYVKNINEHIGYIAHFAGALAGLLVGINVLRNLHVTKREKIIWWISLSVYLTLMSGATVWNIFS